MKFKDFMEALSRESKDEYMARYATASGRTFEVWIRRLTPNSASISYLRAYGEGKADFTEVLPQFKADLKALGITDIQYSTALDDKTGGKSRDRLFNRYMRMGQVNDG